jgi:cytochrome oxidase assembly protein ShyY1
MVRRLLTPRWVGLTLLALVIVVTFVLLGVWQLGRAQAMVRPVTDDDPAPVALGTLSPASGYLPDDAAGRRVTVEGTYDAAHGFLVPGQQVGGRTGYYVVGLLRLADGSGVLVVRGWTSSATPSPAPPPTGQVTVSGRLAVSQAPDGGLDPGATLPPGQLAAVSPVNLLGTVTYQVHDGYVVASATQPADPAQLTAVPVEPPGSGVPGFFLQHAGYVALWWLFALFVIAFWGRLLYDDLHPRADDDELTGAASVAPPARG